MRALAALALLTAIPVAAQPLVPPATERAAFLDGEWAGEGTIFGKPSRVSLSVKPALGSTAIILDYSVETVEKPGLKFSGHAIYRVTDKTRWEGRWLDSSGKFRDLSAELQPDGMSVVWGDPASEIGRTSYVREGDRLTLVDAVLRPSGQFETFATARLTKR